MIRRILAEKNRFNVLRVYLYINAHSDGCAIINGNAQWQIAEALGFKDARTVRKILRWLRQEYGWVRKDEERNVYYIDGFSRILGFERRKKENRGKRITRWGVRIDIANDLADLERFKAMLGGAYFGGIARRKNAQYKKGELSAYQERFTGSSAPRSCSLSSFWGIAANYAVKDLGIAKSTAQIYRNLAERYGFLKIWRHRRPLTQQEVQFRRYLGGDAFAMIHDKQGRYAVDSVHWIRSMSLEYGRIAAVKRTKLSMAKAERMRAHAPVPSASIPSNVPIADLANIPF